MPQLDYAIDSILPSTQMGTLQADKNIFSKNYNLNSFMFNHNLNSNRLFEIPQIINLAKIMIDRGDSSNFTAVNFKQASVDAKIRAMPSRERLASVVENLNETGSWIKLTRVQDFAPEYAALLKELTGELEELAGTTFQRDVTWSTMTVFLSSPRITTPFHIDHESNFLFQIHGNKEVCLFDGSDRELVPDVEVENFYFGNGGGANYKPDMQDRGTIYKLTPGTVVHHPPLAPHWVKNDNNISVSLSLGYCMKPLESRARVYQANFMLRKLGMKPTPPGVAPFRDAVKASLISALEKRSPRTYHEIVYSPVDKLKSPLRGFRRLVGAKG